MRKRYLSRESLTYEIYAGISKAAHKVFRQKGASSIREFPLPHNLQFFPWNLWLNTIPYGILRHSMGVGFLPHTPENNVKIT